MRSGAAWKAAAAGAMSVVARPRELTRRLEPASIPDESFGGRVNA